MLTSELWEIDHGILGHEMLGQVNVAAQVREVKNQRIQAN